MFSYTRCITVTASSVLQSAEGGREEARESQTCVGQTPRYFGAPEQEQLITPLDTSFIISNDELDYKGCSVFNVKTQSDCKNK